jgi:predicted dehydrogenase
MSRVGFGVVGAGVAGIMRARTIARHPGARLVMVADVDRKRADDVARAAGAEAAEDYRAVIDAPGVAAVVVSSPVHLHEEMVCAALRAGRHVLCEKPLSNTVDSCRRMLEAASASGRVLAVGFNHRYYPCFRVLRRIVEEGSLGPIDHVRAFGGHQGMSQFRAPWMYERQTLGGGAMMDVGIHVSDLVQYLGFHPSEVTARTTNGVWNLEGSEDNAMVLARTAAGVPITYQATWTEWKGYRLRVEVYGRDGMALGSYPPLYNLVVRRDGERFRREWQFHPGVNLRERWFGWTRTAEDAFTDELSDFLGRLEGRPGLGATGLDGLRAVEFAAAAVQSSESGAMVRMSI